MAAFVASMSFSQYVGQTIYKYALLICNCRNDFDTAAYTSTSDEYLSPLSPNGGVATNASLDYLTQFVDKLLEGTDEDKEKAYKMLHDNQHLVRSSLSIYNHCLRSRTFCFLKCQKVMFFKLMNPVITVIH